MPTARRRPAVDRPAWIGGALALLDAPDGIGCDRSRVGLLSLGRDRLGYLARLYALGRDRLCGESAGWAGYAADAEGTAPELAYYLLSKTNAVQCITRGLQSADALAAGPGA